ncbi:MAG: tetratricopeptide repeat protein [Selenomonadaceae bacterium]|nr:tetratricopeptide repeat protein [Selenomonadaceae bacterium]
MKRFLTVLLIAGNLFFMPAASAEIKTYDGVGEYIMSDFETFDVAQQRAKQRAEQNACEQAGVYVESRTEVRNAQVTKDEIITMTSGILKIVDVQYKREILNDNTTRIRATVKANIDSDDINKWLAKGSGERATLGEQNEELRRANAEQDKQIAELKQQLANMKTQQDKERIKQKIIDGDKFSLSEQKLKVGIKFGTSGDFNNAITFYTKAIELNSNNNYAYYLRAVAYKALKKYKQAIEDYNKSIVLNPYNGNAYSGLGDCYRSLKNYDKAIENYNKALKINPKDSLTYTSRGLCYQAIGNYSQAKADFYKSDNLKNHHD